MVCSAFHIASMSRTLPHPFWLWLFSVRFHLIASWVPVPPKATLALPCGKVRRIPRGLLTPAAGFSHRRVLTILLSFLPHNDTVPEVKALIGPGVNPLIFPAFFFIHAGGRRYLSFPSLDSRHVGSTTCVAFTFFPPPPVMLGLKT